MKVLVLGHPLVVDVNREIWSYLAQQNTVSVDLVVPQSWKSNLISEIKYEVSPRDSHFDNIFPTECLNKGNGSLYFFSPWKLFKILSKQKYDHIILTQETWSLSLAFLWLIKKFTKNSASKILLWVCQNIKKPNLYKLRFFERIITSDVNRIVGCCSETMDVIDWKGIKTEKYYLPFSIEEDRFQFQLKDSEEINIGYIGRISEEKGIEDLLKVISKYQDNKRIKFHVAGAGNLEDEVKKYHFIDFHGVLKHREVFDFYSKMHIIVLPSRTKAFWKEQFGRVIVEGAASGAIIVGSNSGAIPEVMGIVGLSDFIFEERNVEDFQSKLELAIKYIEEGGDRKIFAKRAVLNFSHGNVAQLVYRYLSHPEEERGKIERNGVINGFT